MKAETCRVSVCRCEGTRVPGPPCSTRWTQKAVTWFFSDIVNNVNIYLSTVVSRLFWMTESSAAATGGTYSSALPCLALTSLILQLCVCSAFHSAACYPAMLSMLFHAPLYSPWLAMTCHDCPCLVTRTALELQSVHLGLLSKADYCTILYSAHEYIEQLYINIYIYIYNMKLYEQLGKLMQSFSFDTLIHSVLPALQKVIWATECPPRKQWSRSDESHAQLHLCRVSVWKLWRIRTVSNPKWGSIEK